MDNKAEIRAKYLAQHNALGTRRDAGDKELFDQQHRQVWANCDIELQARKTELLALVSPTSAEGTELTELEFMFPTPPKPARDLAKEIDELRAKVEKLEKK